MDLQAFRAAVSAEMLRCYGITWADADGGDAPLAEAIAAGHTPTGFVEWWGEKYDLTPRRQASLHEF